jgi:hypothetical protein
MNRGTTLLIFTLLLAAESAVAQDHLRTHPFRKNTDAFFATRHAETDDEEAGPTDGAKNLLKAINANEIGVRPLFVLLPTEEPHGRRAGDVKSAPEEAPPTFALVARATGGTLVSFTRPGTKIEARHDLIYQRNVVSDLFSSRPVSLSIYEDHVLDGDALRFLGIGGRVSPRPTVKVLGWTLRLDLFGSFHPDHGATGYLAISGALSDPGAPPPPAAPAIR